jgi:hypothetical protein
MFDDMFDGTGDSSSRHESVQSGIYRGSWEAADNSHSTLDALISGDKLYAHASEGTIVDLNVKLTGTSVTATGHFYNDVTKVMEGTIQGRGTLKGTDIEMKLERSDGIVNTVTLKRGVESNDASSFDLMQGEYNNLSQTMDIKLSAKGALSGYDTEGCNYSGDIDIIDSAINVYALTVNVSNCRDYGNYTGLMSRKRDGDIFGIYGDSEYLSQVLLTKHAD